MAGTSIMGTSSGKNDSQIRKKLSDVIQKLRTIGVPSNLEDLPRCETGVKSFQEFLGFVMQTQNIVTNVHIALT
ncbi:hypothetical protein FGO68_gene11731 [Halteria grandinella]|uniref:Uncharacterized protein n=1 Tax=Halteria grandinella TaxID=5974 RepID=A0A8J8SUX7_HALGN|nr:hypothetical protein FGO68_gene11731 [Halteria grandinella]